MIKNNQKKLNGLHVVLDGLIIILSYSLAWTLLYVGNRIFTPNITLLPPQIYFGCLIAIVPLYLVLYTFFQLYTPKRIQRRRYEFANICKANLAGLLIISMLFWLLNKNPYIREFSRRMVFYLFAINVVAETIERNAIRQVLRSMRGKGYNQKHILLIGYSRAAESFIDRVKANPEWGYHVYGMLDDNTVSGTEYQGVKVLGTISQLDSILELNTLDEIAITLGLGEYTKLEDIVSSCEKSGVHTKFIPDYNNVIPTRPYTEDLQGLPVINIRHVPLNGLLNKTIKRAVDIFGALVGIVVFSPIMLVTAAIIKLTSPGPLIARNGWDFIIALLRCISFALWRYSLQRQKKANGLLLMIPE